MNRKSALHVKGEENGNVSSLGGFRITPFSLREENEDGSFDELGNFTLSNNERRDRQKDAWLEQYEESFGSKPFQV